MTVDATAGRSSCAATRDHPFTRGFLCQKVARYLDRVYHPDRLLYPMRRVGPKGDGRFERISLGRGDRDRSPTRFRAIAASADGPQAILPYSYAGTMGKLQVGSLDRRFFHRLGRVAARPHDLRHGRRRRLRHHARHAGGDRPGGGRSTARYIVNWGSNTAVTNIHLWSVDARGPQGRGAGSSPSTRTAARRPPKSDWWIPIRPGTDAALRARA